MEILFYKCSCNDGLIKRTTEILPNGTNKIGVHPCLKCFNRPHIFLLKDYQKINFMSKTVVGKIYEMLDNNEISNLAEMKEWFLIEEKENLKKSFDFSYKEMHNSFSNDYYKQKTFDDFYQEAFNDKVG